MIRNIARVACIEDLKRTARHRVPKMFYEYCDSGSWTESTYRANEDDYSKLKFKQKIAVDISTRSTEATMLGTPYKMPLALSPVGLLGMQHADGEILAALAAKRFGVPFTLSTMSICSIESVAKATDYHPFWFQLYVMNDKTFLYEIIERAKNANCSALVITLDLQILAQRNKDVHNGLTAPPKPTLANLLNLATKPRWLLNMSKTKHHHFGNIIGHVESVTNTADLNEWSTKQFDLKLDWNAIEDIMKRWGGKVILKGITDADDAERAVNVGADAIVVSNHGGRQLDGTISTIKALPEIIKRVHGKTEIHIDGGIRSGQSILRALALGADAVHVGRPYVYGLGAFGEAGVYKALQMLHNELDITMALCGKTSLSDVNKSILLNPDIFENNSLS